MSKQIQISSTNIIPNNDNHNNKFHHGSCYYPEHWPESQWPLDAQKMVDAGFDTVRIGEFDWAVYEPKEGHFTFDRLEKAVNVLYDAGLKVILGTPTATPPAWLTAKYPSSLRATDYDGVTQMPQTRRHCDANDHDYFRLSMRIVDKMASRFKDHPGVYGYQIDNEYGCHNTVRSTSAASAKKFRSFLQQKYNHSLEELNKAYGAVFWSQAYTDWEQILPPTNANTVPADHNPSLVLDFKRFSSDTWIRFNEAQVAIIKQHNPSHWVTHNMMLYYFHYDMHKLGSSLSTVSWDNYETYGTHPICVAANHDWMYGARSEPFWVMEQQLGQVNWDVHNSQWRPGRLALKVIQSIAHGANGMMYFRWRQCPFGIEQYHSGLLDHAGRGTRFLKEVTRVNEHLRLLEEQGMFVHLPAHEVALVHDCDSHWALESQPHNSKSLGFTTPSLEPCLWVADIAPLTPTEPKNKSGLYILHHYEMLLRRHLGVNILDVTRACELVSNNDNKVYPKYKLVCFPQLHVVDDSIVDTIKAYVDAGGIAIFGPRSGYKTKYNNLHVDSPQPGCGLGDLVGVEVEEFDTSEEGVTQAVIFQNEDNVAKSAGVWYEKLQVKAECSNTAQVWARYGKRQYEPPPTAEWYNPELPKGNEPHRDDVTKDKFDIEHFYEDSPAVVSNECGAGMTVYIGCMGKQVFDFALQKVLENKQGLFGEEIPSGDAEIEVCRRGNWYFLMNHSNDAKVCSGLPVGLKNALATDWNEELLDHNENGQVELAPFSYAIGYKKECES